MAKCPHCDAPIIQGDQYCGSCGATLSPTTAPGAAPPGSRFGGAGFGAPPPPPSLGRPAPSSSPPPPWAPSGSAPSVATLTPVPDLFMPSQPPRTRHSSRVWIGAFIGLVVVAALAAGAVVLFTGGSNPYPKEWDPQVKPIADRVAQLRGLTFEHPVKVEYLSPADFAKEVTASPDELAENKDQIQEATAVLRAAGLLGGNVDLGKAVNDTQATDVIALYSPESKKILVRGTGPFTVETRVTLAHELTHVLQDQHFDLRKLQKEADDSKTGSSDAFTGLVEGDATRIEHKYLAEQSAADRADYQRLSQASSAAAGDHADIPPVIEMIFGAPYIYGPQVVSILENSGGNSAVDNAITGPTPTTRIYLDPTAVNQLPDSPPPVPTLQAGETKLKSETAQDEDFDDFTLYLMLGAHLDPVTALRAADAFKAGSSTAYTTSAGKTCFRAAVTGVNPASEDFLARTLDSWAKKMPDAEVESSSSTDHVPLVRPRSACGLPERDRRPQRRPRSRRPVISSPRRSSRTVTSRPTSRFARPACCVENPTFRAIVSKNTRQAFEEGARAGQQAALGLPARSAGGDPLAGAADAAAQRREAERHAQRADDRDREQRRARGRPRPSRSTRAIAALRAGRSPDSTRRRRSANPRAGSWARTTS